MAGTSGALRGLTGEERRALGLGWLLGVAVCAAIITFNIAGRVHDAPQHGLAPPLIDELSSFATMLLALALPAGAALWMRRSRPAWLLAATANIMAAVLFCAVHVGGFVVLRGLAFEAVLGTHYRFGPLLSELLYEFFKDAIAYVLAVFLFWWIIGREKPAPVAAAAPAMIDIRDGARLVRAPMADILAVRSAGNYAEFLLADGRRPLMRTSLAGLEARLAAQGFLRTHRSWLVNAARVTGLRPEGSGDYAVELGAVEAPLSRRFPAALAALRG